MSAKIADLKIGIKNEGESAVKDLQDLATSLKVIRDTKNNLDFKDVANKSSQGLRQLEMVVQKLTSIMKPLAEQMEKINKGASALASLGAKNIAKTSEKAKSSDVAKKVNTASAEMASDIPTKVSEIATTTANALPATTVAEGSIQKIGVEADFARSKLSLLIERLNLLKAKYAELSADNGNAYQANIVARQIKTTEEQIVRQMQLTTANRSLEQSETTLNATEEKLAETHSKLSRSAKKASDETGRMSKNLKSVSLTSMLAHTGIGRLASSFVRLLKLKGMRMIVQAFYKAIGEGISNLYEYSKALNSVDGSNFANTMDSYKSMALQLKNTVATTLAPVINAVLPLLQKLAGYVIQAANAIARFFAFLNNQSTYTVAKNVAVQWADDTASAAGGASDAVKELQRTILAFDELNVLNSPDRSSGGGGGGAGGSSVDASDMFEERETGQLTGVWEKLANWAKTLKEDAEIIWGWVKKIFDKLVETGVFDTIIGLIDDIVGTVDAVFQELDNTGIIDSLAEVIADILGIVRDIWNSELVQSLVTLGLKSAIDLTVSALKDVKDVLEIIHDLLEGDLPSAVRHIGDLFIDLGATILKALSYIIEGIVKVIDGILNIVASVIDINPMFSDLLFGLTGDELRQQSDTIVAWAEGLGNDLDAQAERRKLAWHIALDSSVADAETAFNAMAGLNADSITKMVKAYEDGRVKIQGNKITFDCDGDGVFETIVGINNEYEKVDSSIENNAITFKVNSTEAVNRAKALNNLWNNELRFNQKELVVTSSNASGTVDKLKSYWNGTTLVAKSLSINTDSAYSAVNNFSSYWKKLNLQKELGVKVNVTSANGKIVAGGMVFQNYASGGFPDYGTLFVAGEQGAGAEMVGNINGRTGVASQDEITGIRQSVEATGNAEARLLAEQNALLRQILAKEGNVTVSTSAIIDGLNRTNRRAGKTVVAMGQ